jgi:hypothetical protein
VRTRRVVVAALATGVVAAARRRRPLASTATRAVPTVPAQPEPAPSHLRLLVEGDADLVLAEQDASDEHVLAVLDAHLRHAV